MPQTKHDDSTFIALWYKHGGATAMAKAEHMDLRALHRRRVRIEEQMGIQLEQTSRPELQDQPRRKSGLRAEATITDGVVLIGSDAHYTPGTATIAHRAFVEAASNMDPARVILAGDVMDLASISKHEASSWEAQFTVKEEIDSASDRMAEIIAASPGAEHDLLWGNHDAARFERFLVANAKQFKGMPGFTFEEHFADWNYSGSLMINSDVMVKHFWHTGIHGAWNNVVKSGINMFTGHTHKLLVRPYTDYRGTRYAAECGCLADVDDEQFDYGMDAPKDQRSGFTVLTFRGGVLLPPEQCEVVRGIGAVFRGQVIVAE